MNNSKKYINQLLDKYWAGETTLEDEKILAAYFNTGQVDEDFKPFKPLFEYFDQQRQVSVDLEDQVMERIRSKRIETKVIRLTWKRALAVAASLILLVTAGISTYRYQLSKKDTLVMQDTFESPEEALEQTKAALLYLSNRMNRVADQTTKSLEKTENLDILN